VTGFYAFVTSPAHSWCPQRQTTSVRLAIPSQWALQYFDPSDGTQLHAGFAHFFGFVIVHLPRSVRCSLARNGPDRLYAGFRCAVAGKRCFLSALSQLPGPSLTRSGRSIASAQLPFG
jgi:hypothetical protein